MNDREMIDQWIVVDLEHGDVPFFSGNTNLEADCAVGYVYVDDMCGMTFNVETWCNVAGDSLRVVARSSDTSQRVILRYGCFAKKRNRLVSTEEMAEMGLPSVPEWLHFYYDDENDAKRQLRSLTLLDPLRAPGYPDDIKCLLDEIGKKYGEWVWVRLNQAIGDNLFICRLLNEPFQDFGLHEGDLIRVVVKELSDGLSSLCIGKDAGH